eukprot:m.100979 g.100979  ORF g.100979 m.100979 type:complete len:775 (-) comp22261_c0_seq2:182-2506(-)
MNLEELDDRLGFTPLPEHVPTRNIFSLEPVEDDDVNGLLLATQLAQRDGSDPLNLSAQQCTTTMNSNFQAQTVEDALTWLPTGLLGPLQLPKYPNSQPPIIEPKVMNHPLFETFSNVSTLAQKGELTETILSSINDSVNNLLEQVREQRQEERQHKTPSSVPYEQDACGGKMRRRMRRGKTKCASCEASRAVIFYQKDWQREQNTRHMICFNCRAAFRRGCNGDKQRDVAKRRYQNMLKLKFKPEQAVKPEKHHSPRAPPEPKNQNPQHKQKPILSLRHLETGEGCVEHLLKLQAEMKLTDEQFQQLEELLAQRLESSKPHDIQSYMPPHIEVVEPCDHEEFEANLDYRPYVCIPVGISAKCKSPNNAAQALVDVHEAMLAHLKDFLDQQGLVADRSISQLKIIKGAVRVNTENLSDTQSCFWGVLHLAPVDNKKVSEETQQEIKETVLNALEGLTMDLCYKFSFFKADEDEVRAAIHAFYHPDDELGIQYHKQLREEQQNAAEILESAMQDDIALLQSYGYRRDACLSALQRTNFNKVEAARVLAEAEFNERLEQLDLEDNENACTLQPTQFAQPVNSALNYFLQGGSAVQHENYGQNGEQSAMEPELARPDEYYEADLPDQRYLNNFGDDEYHTQNKLPLNLASMPDQGMATNSYPLNGGGVQHEAHETQSFGKQEERSELAQQHQQAGQSCFESKQPGLRPVQPGVNRSGNDSDGYPKTNRIPANSRDQKVCPFSLCMDPPKQAQSCPMEQESQVKSRQQVALPVTLDCTP